MKAITIKQPWATLIMSGVKRFEFRSWKTNFRGDVLIHAGKGIDKEAVERLAKYLPDELPMGKILGKVTITDCVSFSRNFGFQMENVVPFKKQIDAKGQLGFWNIDIDEKELI